MVPPVSNEDDAPETDTLVLAFGEHLPTVTFPVAVPDKEAQLTLVAANAGVEIPTTATEVGMDMAIAVAVTILNRRIVSFVSMQSELFRRRGTCTQAQSTSHSNRCRGR